MMPKRLLPIAALLLAFVSISAGPPAVRKPNHAISIENMTFNPAGIEIKVGESIEWTNNDDRDHNVTAKDKSFASGNLGSGDTFNYAFKKAGKFSYGCSLHPRMKGVVVVSDDSPPGK